jgi:uncharacterized protein (DUF3820 family)
MAFNVDIKSRMPVGKYKGKLISDLMKIDPEYLKWAYKSNIINPDNVLKQRLRENMKIKQLREAIREIIRKELNENQPKPATTPNEPAVLPKPKTDEPDKKRRKIGNPDVKPAPKNLKEEEMIDKITARFKSKK